MATISRMLLAVGLLSTPLTLAACADTGPVETTWEVTGDKGATAEIVMTSKSDQGTTRTVTLPWREKNVPDQGEASLQVKPATGAVTCRIATDKEIAKVVGKAGETVTCRGNLQD